jgi:signal transduction histidine kinase
VSDPASVPTPEIPHRLLVVDDEESQLSSIYHYLTNKGFDVEQASSGNEALEILGSRISAQQPIDLLITDIVMPGINGEELIKAARVLDPSLPILVMTGFGKKDLLIRLMRLNCQDFVDKPVSNADLEEHTRQVLNATEHVRLDRRRKDELAAMGLKVRAVIHDLTNMMNNTMGYAGLALRDVEETHPARTRLSKMLASANLAGELMKNLMTLRAESGTATLTKEEVRPFMEKLGSLFRTISPESVNVEVRLLNDSLVASLDFERVQQAILNLGLNALDAMPLGGTLTLKASAKPVVRSKDREPVYCVCIAIKDTGGGISKENLSKLFTEGFTTKPQGHGFGLSVVHTIVEEHDGWIEIASEEGKGTAFRMYFPQKGGRLG